MPEDKLGVRQMGNAVAARGADCIVDSVGARWALHLGHATWPEDVSPTACPCCGLLQERMAKDKLGVWRRNGAVAAKWQTA